ncbi:hypothetical protein LSH36_672g01022 [Paralvinella palmiformis]|uniref:Uncharacterized protein n=1 Tax=Paralvinella palmiformis TaxID=53620 RepID=A0AAD9J2X1_9ANNE|nr:hypothetical protein LSH36_672g01022 [Paralvinella palmiformis]
MLIISVTPRDLSSFNPITDASLRGHVTHGYQGFPVNNFEKSRDRAIQDHLSETKNSPRNHYHGVSHYLDTKKPLVVGEAKGFQYGSDEPQFLQQFKGKEGYRTDKKTSEELMRFHQQRDEAEFNIQQYKRERQQKIKDRVEEKKRDMDMLKSYNPWGRPGGGAPMRSDDENHNPFQSDYPQSSRTEEADYGNFIDNFGKPGHGAPLRTKSGKLKTELKGDTDIRFQKTETGRAVYNQELRYQGDGEKKLQYQQELENQMQMQKQKAQQEKLENLKKELHSLHQDPYNILGTEAAVKSRSEIEKSAMNRTYTDYDAYDPWGKGVGQPRRDQFGDVKRYHYSDPVRKEVYTEKSTHLLTPEEGNSLPLEQSPGGAGAPVITPSGNVMTRKIISMSKTESGDTTIRDDLPGFSKKRNNPALDDSEFGIYDPFGKVGGGAPLKDQKGHINTAIYGKMRDQTGERNPSAAEAKREAAHEYLNELQREMEQQKRIKDEEERNLKEKSEGLADLMKKGQVGKPKRDPKTGLLLSQHLGRTDVTMNQMQERHMKTEKSLEYHTELEKAAEERKRTQALDLLKEKQQTKQHQQYMDHFWGRPGGGAPNPQTRKVKLDEILYSPRKELNDFYNKSLDANQKPHNFVRNTVNSLHTNLYEYPLPHKRLPKKDYKLLVPYAISSEDSL